MKKNDPREPKKDPAPRPREIEPPKPPIDRPHPDEPEIKDPRPRREIDLGRHADEDEKGS